MVAERGAAWHSPMAQDRTGIKTWLLLASLGLAGCSAFESKQAKPAPSVDPNVFPAKYEKDIAIFLLTKLTDRADFRGALIAEPAMKPVSTSQRWVVCLRFVGNNQRTDKVAVYLAGEIIQFISPTPEQCGDAQFRPFRDLDQVAPG